MVGDPRNNCADALVEEGHGRGAMDQISQGLYQFLSETRLQRSESSKLL